ncbi:hypothetical protein FGG08_004653 [Glutinoglossum americanum]|uniref:Uncharacterized protein n=1 Tax=Glutinoglossum americanum TaxID=1670608 RepID=A0A9P8IAY1_9PEZI|nr:hypothetical protein FGG08_004653 [Glutinoglossum americanum]
MVELWSTMSSPSYTNSFRLPAKLIHTEPSSTASADDIQRVHGYQDYIYNPDCEQMVTAILSVVIDKPHLPLPPEYNSILLHVLESYNSLVKSLEKGKHDTEIDALAMEQTLRDWEKDRKDFKGEIKRLEKRITELQGTKAMLKAREDSILGKKNYETSDGAIARIRRKRKSKGKESGPNHKLLYQPSIINRSRISLSPPRTNKSMELHVGHPPTARSHMAFSAFMELPHTAPDSGKPIDGAHPAGPSDRAPIGHACLLLSSSNTKKMEDNLFSTSGSSSDASSIGDSPPKPYGPMCPQRQRHSRRQFSFASGDDSKTRLRDPTTPTQQGAQSYPNILGNSVAYNEEQALLVVSPTDAYAKMQEHPRCRSSSSSSYSVASDGGIEIFGPPNQMNGPKISALESLERVKASIHATRKRTGASVPYSITAAPAGSQKETTQKIAASRVDPPLEHSRQGKD